MRFREALRLAASRLGLAGGPEARFGQAGAFLVLGSALLALGRVSATVALIGAGVWFCGLAAGIRGLLGLGGERRWSPGGRLQATPRPRPRPVQGTDGGPRR